MFHLTSVFKEPIIYQAVGIWTGESPHQLPLAQFGRRGWDSNLLSWLPHRPCHAQCCRTVGVITLLPTSLTPAYLSTLDSPSVPSSLLLPLLRPFLPFFLGLIKKHLLAIHCISEQNLYFRHVEPWILNLNTNVARCPYYFIPFYLSVIIPSRIQHAERCKCVTKMRSPKNNRRKLGCLILIKSCVGKAEFKAEGAARECTCFTIAPGLLYHILGKRNPKLPLLNFSILASI